MKEKIKIKTIVCCLMMTSMLLGLGACNNEDDVMEIFNNKTWKLVRIHAVNSSINDAVLKIDGKEHTISIKGKVIGTESDKLAKVFINGIQNVFKYEGDIHNITLYFKDGNTTKVMGFTAR